MRVVLSRILCLVPIVFAWVNVASSAIGFVSLQDTAKSPGPGEQSFSQEFDELQDIKFYGCVETTPEQLIGVIESRTSELSFTHRLALYYNDNVKRNTATPKEVKRTLSKVQQDLEDELRYFNADIAEDDSAALMNYLHQNGFHNAAVSWKFEYNNQTYLNTLTFYIEEGQRATIDTVVYRGLDNLPHEVYDAVSDVRKIKKGDHYNETDLDKEVRQVINELNNSGYYRAYAEIPVMSTSDDYLHDTILVKIETGPRARVRQVVFIEDPNGNPVVNESMRRRQLEFKEGDWYNKEKLNQSRANLIGLGTFEVVNVDTIVVDFLDSTYKQASDSNVAIQVFTKNAKVYDIYPGIVGFQTAVDNYVNFGVGVTALYKNTFGGAQATTADLSYVWQDIGRAFQGEPLEREALARFMVTWPSAVRVSGFRAGLKTLASYSYRQLVYPFRMGTFTLGSVVPINFYSHTFINGFDFNVSIERQVPENFDDQLDTALADVDRNNGTAEDSALVYSTYNQFLVLDAYLNDPNSPFFTGLYVGGNVRGEHRDNPVNPKRGMFTSIAFELGTGAGRFFKGQFLNTNVIPINPRLGIATKIKLGHIALLDFVYGSESDTNTYVPLERQFFAGGASSIRSYPSRRLHDPHSGTIPTETEAQDQQLANIVGSATLIELSLELRYMFPRPRGIDDLWAGLVERSGVTFFMDAGNAFNRLTVDLYSTMRLEDLYKGSVVAAGMGYRFDTPVGPFRLDLATSIYDPLRTEGKWIFGERTNIFGSTNWQLSLGLGHAF